MTADPVQFLEKNIERLRKQEAKIEADRAAAADKFERQLAPIADQVAAHLSAIDTLKKATRPKRDCSGTVLEAIRSQGEHGATFTLIRDAVKLKYELTRNEAQGTVFNTLGYLTQRGKIRVEDKSSTRRYFLADN